MEVQVNPDKAFRTVYVDAGQRIRLVFKDDFAQEYIVARIRRNEYVLINLQTGGRWTDPIECITEPDASNKFKLNVPLQRLLGKELLRSSREILKFYQNNVEVFVQVRKQT
jgi:hypothetical protein